MYPNTYFDSWRVTTQLPDIREQMRDLRRDTLHFALLLVTGGFAFWFLANTAIWLPQQSPNVKAIEQSYRVAIVLVPVLAASWMLVKDHLRLAALVFVAGNLLAITWATWVLGSDQVFMLFPFLALIAAFVFDPRGGAVVAVSAVALVGGLGAIRPDVVGTADIWQIAFFEAVAVASVWVLTRHLLLALKWYSDSYARAESQMREARDHRAQLVQAWTQLDVAYAQLSRANDELERARRASAAARQLKTEFAASISHELRTPLNLIIGFSEMMIMNPETYGGSQLASSYRGDIEAIYRNSSHLSSLVDDILDLSKIDAHRMALRHDQLRIERVVEEAVAAVGSMFVDKGLTLDVRLPAGLSTLSADQTRIRQVLINLLNNAARFTAHGGVTIGGVSDEREIVIWVTDTGTGIPTEDIPHVFDEFYQVGGTNWRRSTGLGLAISKRFVELHGGNMWCESRPGEGSTFYFSLPTRANVVAIPAQDEWQTWARSEAGDASARTIAVLGDDAEVVSILRRYLDGFEAVGIANTAELARAIAVRTVRAIVVPDAATRAAALAVLDRTEDHAQTPVVICPIRSSGVIGREIGVLRLLTKPVAARQVRELLAGPAADARDILIVDDDPEMVRLLARLIQAEGGGALRHTRVAGDGAEALRLLREQKPDLLLLDLLMPGIDGYGVLAELRADPTLSEVPVVLVTAKGVDESATAAELVISRPGGLTVGEVTRCLEAGLNALLEPRAADSVPALPVAPAD